MKKIARLEEENTWFKSQLAEAMIQKRDLREENHRLLAELERLQEALAADAWTRWGNAVAHGRRVDVPSSTNTPGIAQRDDANRVWSLPIRRAGRT